ncbi:MAG: tRNA lysidine(34) synthetase TilS [Gemmataceae bacterium]|nr:tRNA lysidine(34) synthetase TilS [Gemmataceae bacterium]
MIRLDDLVYDFLRKHSLLNVPGVLAVSGGPDSLALATAFIEKSGEVGIPPIHLAHFNHKLRGADSDADESFVNDFAARFHVPFRSTQCDIAAAACEAKANLEETARTARYGWLADVTREVGARWIATGHTADDQAETILHHFLRGAGIRGLGGMPEVRELKPGIALVRPLLGLLRADVLAYLAKRNLTPRHDATNDDVDRTRSRLRHETIPALSAQFNPALIEVVGRLGEQCREVQSLIDSLAGDLLIRAELPRAGDMCIVRAPTIADASPILAAEAFRLIWRREGWPMGEMNYDDWRHLAVLARQTKGARDFPGPIHVRRVGGVIQLSRRLM